MSRVVTAFFMVLAAGCSDEEFKTVCWLRSEMPAPPESTASDLLNSEQRLDYERRRFFYCAEDTAYQVIQLGGDGEFANAAAMKDCSYNRLRDYKDASYWYQKHHEPSAPDEALQKLTDEDVEKLLNDFSTQIEVFKLCHAKGIKSPSWN